MRTRTDLLAGGSPLRAAAYLFLVLAAACGPFRRGQDPNEARLVFRNESTEQAAVYAVVPGLDETRLGTVMSLRTDTLRVPASVTARGSVHIVARLLARSERPSTGPVSIAPGTTLEVRLSSNLTQLSVIGTVGVR